MTPSQYVRKHYPEAYSEKGYHDNCWYIRNTDYIKTRLGEGTNAYNAWKDARDNLKKKEVKASLK